MHFKIYSEFWLGFLVILCLCVNFQIIKIFYFNVAKFSVFINGP